MAEAFLNLIINLLSFVFQKILLFIVMFDVCKIRYFHLLLPNIDQLRFKVFLLILQENVNKLNMRSLSTMLIAEPTVINLAIKTDDFIFFCF